MDKLESLRNRIKQMDREILTLVRKRMETAMEIGRIKKSRGAPLRDWEQEKLVIRRAEKFAEESGFSRETARKIMQILISESRITQEVSHFSSYSGDREDILIIGGLGEMGKWFSGFFSNQGHRVHIYDIKGTSDQFPSYSTLNLALKNCSCALIATSLDTVPSIIEQITTTGFNGIVFDIASFKGFLKEKVDNAIRAGIRYTSIHPMFGPGARTLSDKTICFINAGCDDANRQVKSFFSETAAALVDLTFKEHDKIVSYILGLSHLVNVIFSDVLVKSRIDYEFLQRIGSTTFNSQMKTTESVIREKPDLYFAIQHSNPFRKELYSELLKSTQFITETVNSGDFDTFVKVLSTAKNWLGKS